jgi:ribonuclease P protein component
MMPPQASPTGYPVSGSTPAAASLRLDVLRKRSDFLHAARGHRVVTPGFILQANRRTADAGATSRVGFTCSKKVGNAVARNRAKRRLRAIAQQLLPNLGDPQLDYVLVGRKDTTASLPFAQLLQDLERALNKMRVK